MSTTRILGIDPGVSGGIAYLTMDGKPIDAWPMPETERDLFDLIVEHREDCCALLEQVRSRPKQAPSSMFKFGWSYGGVRMALIAAGIPFTELIPTQWQKIVGLGQQVDKKDRKKISRARAQELFPSLGKKITHKTADALLLAEACRRIQCRM